MFCIPNDSQLQNVESGQDVPFEQSFHLPSGSRKKNENFVEADGATFTVPVLNKVQGDTKVGNFVQYKNL